MGIGCDDFEAVVRIIGIEFCAGLLRAKPYTSARMLLAGKAKFFITAPSKKEEGNSIPELRLKDVETRIEITFDDGPRMFPGDDLAVRKYGNPKEKCAYIGNVKYPALIAGRAGEPSVGFVPPVLIAIQLPLAIYSQLSHLSDKDIQARMTHVAVEEKNESCVVAVIERMEFSVRVREAA